MKKSTQNEWCNSYPQSGVGHAMKLSPGLAPSPPSSVTVKAFLAALQQGRWKRREHALLQRTTTCGKNWEG